MGSNIVWGLAWLLALLLIPVLVPASCGRCHGGEQAPVVPTASTGPGPAVGRSGRDGGSCRAGGLLACGGPAAGGEGWGPRHCAVSSRCTRSSVLAGPEEGRAGPAQGLPGWDPSTSRPPALSQGGGAGPWRPISHPAGSTGVKVLAALAHGGRNGVLLVLALGETAVTPKRPRNSLVPRP